MAGPIRIRVVADEAVDPAFGTGVIKVTPGHDPIDFEIGRRHQLPVRTVIGFDGKMTELAGPRYAGVASFRPMMPATIRSTLPRRARSAGSPNSAMPRITVPTAPTPTQTL